MKRGYVFQDIYNGYTMGYLRIDKVAADTSEGNVFYIIPGEQIKENSYAIESKRYPNFVGGRLTFSVSNEGLNFTLGYVSSDIYNNHKQSFSIGYSIPIYLRQLRQINCSQNHRSLYFQSNLRYTSI